MTLRLRLSPLRVRAFYERRRSPMTFSPWRGGLQAQRGHCNYRKLTQRWK